MFLDRFRRIVATGLLFVVCACGGGRSPGAPVNDPPDGGDVPGAPQRTDPVRVPTAPINIPPIFDKQGLPIDQVRELVSSEIRDACGDGELCVDVVVDRGDSDTIDECSYLTSDPASHPDEDFVLDRGSTLTLLTGSRTPCG